jgi:hypothetical protein
LKNREKHMTTAELLGVIVSLISLLVIGLLIVWRLLRQRIRLNFCMNPIPHILVHNKGAKPVHLTSVDLVAGDQTFHLRCVKKDGFVMGRDGFKPNWVCSIDTMYDNPLEPGNGCEFMLVDLPARSDGAYIVARSHSGEVGRLRGKPVTDLIAAVPARQKARR